MKRILRLALSLAGVAALVALVAGSWLIVDETQYVVVTDFGRIVAVYGDQPDEAGLHWKWPWQSAIPIDRRLRVFDPPAREVLTGDKRNLEVASYVVWRVGEPLRFLRSAATLDAAEARLSERVAAALSNAIGRRELAALASTDPAHWQLDQLTADVLAAVAPQAQAELGLDVLDVRLRRFTPPLEVRPAVFDLIRSERRQVAATLRAEGEAEYLAITSQAERQRDATLAQADAEAERIRGRGAALATQVANEAHARDPRFAEFLRTLDAYRAILDDKATVVLSSGSPLLRLLTQGPSEDLLHTPAPAQAAVPPSAAGADESQRSEQRP
jgi:membrane protease subunit HflC